MFPTIFSVKEKQEARLKICFSCQYIKYIPIANIAQCSACGCPIKSKIKINSASCPKGKW